MRVAILGGAGAMGGLFGSRLALAGNTVTLIDVWREAVEAINTCGLRVTENGRTRTVRVKAVADPAEAGPADLVIVLVKGQHTESAVRSGLPLIKNETAVLTLQNGWGNADRIAGIVGRERVLAGVTLHSVTTVGPGHIQHAGQGPTTIGELDGRMTPRLGLITELLSAAGFEVSATGNVLKVIWSKLALNVCSLPVCALLRFRSGQLVEHEGTLDLMRALLHEVVAVANAQGIHLNYEESWEAITSQLRRAANVRASMLQDVENGRLTEIETINGAIIECGRQLKIPTPYNDALVWLMRSLQETFTAAPPGADPAITKQSQRTDTPIAIVKEP